MALTRNALKAMGIESDKIDEIIEAHSETVEALKAERDDARAQAKEADALKKELEELKAQGDGDGYQAKYEKLKSEFEEYKATTEQEKTMGAKRDGYKKLLEAAGVDPKRLDAVLRVSNLDDLEYKDGAFTDADKLTEAIKNEWGDFIQAKSTEGTSPATPPKASEGAGPDFSKMTASEYLAWKHNNKE